MGISGKGFLKKGPSKSGMWYLSCILQRMGLSSFNDWNVWAECYIAAFDIIARTG